jgi:hypothetical protein
MTPREIQQFKDAGKAMIGLAEVAQNAQSLREELSILRQQRNAEKIDGQDIEYWHRVATSALATNHNLISRQRELLASLKEKERINADLEQQLRAADIASGGTPIRYKVDGKEVSEAFFETWKKEYPIHAIYEERDGWKEGKTLIQA